MEQNTSNQAIWALAAQLDAELDKWDESLTIVDSPHKTVRMSALAALHAYWDASGYVAPCNDAAPDSGPLSQRETLTHYPVGTDDAYPVATVPHLYRYAGWSTVPVPAPRSLSKTELDGLSELLPIAANPDGWTVWQGTDFMSDGSELIHRVPGSRPGVRNDRTDHYAWCEAVSAGRRGRVTKCDKVYHGKRNDWVCPIHGAESVRGATLPIPADLDRSGKHRVEDDTKTDPDTGVAKVGNQTVRLANAKSVRYSRRLTGMVFTDRDAVNVRPVPSEPVMADYDWPIRTDAAKPDSGKILHYVAQPSHSTPTRDDLPIPVAVVGQDAKGRAIVRNVPFVWRLASPGAPAGSTMRTYGGILMEKVPVRYFLADMRNADGKLPKGRLTMPNAARASLIARDAAVADILDKQVKSTKTVQSAATAKMVRTKQARSAARVAGLLKSL